MPVHHDKREAEAAATDIAPDAKRPCCTSTAATTAHSLTMTTSLSSAPIDAEAAAGTETASTPAPQQQQEPPRHRPQQSLQPTVQLTPQETELFDFLLDVEKQYGCACVLRVAGGWVRDKLLGRHSDDVDIVLDCMKGKEFADLINTYEADHGHKQHPVGVIKANPEQSKHLETATMQLGAIGWVDFVNLRAETYSEDHRIPDVEFGTPLQDAERRDFTINSLFYNIQTRCVEDFTGRGLADLRDGVLRTPLDPRVTFLDDPLRVLRAVRFASRFDLALDDALRAAVELHEVKEALVKKVSRERVGKELVGMLVGSAAHPARALRLLYELQLCGAVFLPSLGYNVYSSDGTVVDATDAAFHLQTWDRGYACAAQMYALVASDSSTVDRTSTSTTLGTTLGTTLDIGALSDAAQHALKLRVLASFLLPLRAHFVLEKKRPVLLPTFVIREALKASWRLSTFECALRTRDAEDVGNVILKHVDALRALADAPTFNRVAVALLLRELKTHWALCRDAALVDELVASAGSSAAEEHQRVHAKYRAFSDAVVANDLIGVWDLKPLLNGNEVVKELGVKPGPGIKQQLDAILVWQLEHPRGTRDECLAHFQAQQ